MKTPLFLLVLAGACQAQTFVSACHSNNGGNSPASCTLSVTANNCVFIGVATNGNNGPVTMSGNSDTYSSVVGPTDNTGTTTGHHIFQVFKTKVATTNASDSVTATWANNGSFQYMMAAQYSGLDSSCTVDQIATPNSFLLTCSSPCTAPNNTTGQSKTNELVIGFFSWGNVGTSTFTAGSGYTARDTSGNGQIAIGVEDKNISAAGTQTGDATVNVNNIKGVDFLFTVQTSTSAVGGGVRHKVVTN